MEITRRDAVALAAAFSANVRGVVIGAAATRDVGDDHAANL